MKYHNIITKYLGKIVKLYLSKKIFQQPHTVIIWSLNWNFQGKAQAWVSKKFRWLASFYANFVHAGFDYVSSSLANWIFFRFLKLLRVSFSCCQNWFHIITYLFLFCLGEYVNGVIVSSAAEMISTLNLKISAKRQTKW